jgi:hypothetical protein
MIKHIDACQKHPRHLKTDAVRLECRCMDYEA